MRDRDVRLATWAVLKEQHTSEPDVLMLDELGLCHGDVRVDIAVVNGELCGYELKSESDTLDRLPAQVAAYSAVLDRATLVCASSHLSKAKKLVPRWWGLWNATEANGVVTLEVVRAVAPNPSPDAFAIAQLLWKHEALDVLEGLGRARGLRSKPRHDLYTALASHLQLPALQSCVRARLKSREGWRRAAPAAPPA